jgi:SpoVK/Ycf46/Vps4 family AAA+-type ATPase
MFEKFTFDDLEKYDLEEVRRKRDVALSNVVNDIRSALVEVENYNLSKIDMMEDFNEKLQELEEIHKKLDYLKRWLTKQKNVLKKVKS